MGVVHEPIEDAVGQSGIADLHAGQRNPLTSSGPPCGARALLPRSGGFHTHA